MKQRIGKLHRGERVTMVFRDVISHESGWVYRDDYDYHQTIGASVMEVTGHFLKIEHDCYFLASLFRHADEAFASVTAIPKGCVLKVVRHK